MSDFQSTELYSSIGIQLFIEYSILQILARTTKIETPLNFIFRDSFPTCEPLETPSFRVRMVLFWEKPINSIVFNKYRAACKTLSDIFPATAS